MENCRSSEQPLPIEAVVSKICSSDRGQFVVTYQISGRSVYLIPQGESITFTLSDECWRGDYRPDIGQVVLLEGVEKYARGWRAKIARPYTP